MRIIDKFMDITTDLSSIGLIQTDESWIGHFCTPKNAVVFANIGCDGIHFCILPDEKDLTLENSSVYVVSPMMPDHYVEAVAENFYDFLSIVVSIKDASVLESISYIEKKKFLDCINTIQDNYEIKKAISVIADIFPIRNIDDVYDYVKQVQTKIDLTKIQYTEEYYESTGKIL